MKKKINIFVFLTVFLTLWFNVFVFADTTSQTNSFIAQFKSEKTSIQKIESISSSEIKVTWNKVAGAEGYYIYYKTGSAKWKRIASVKETVYLHKSSSSCPIKTGVTYQYGILAYRHENGEEICSSYKAASGKAIPDMPKLVSTSSNAYNKITIKWNAAGGAERYKVYGKQSDNSKWIYLGNTVNTSYTVTSSSKFDISLGKQYIFSVRSYTSVEETDGRYDKNGIKGSSKLALPEWEYIRSVSEGLKLRWKKSAGAQGYKIYRRDNGKWKLKADVTTLSWTDKNVKRDVVYTYGIKAYKKMNGVTYESSYMEKGGKNRGILTIAVVDTSYWNCLETVNTLSRLGANAVHVNWNCDPADYDGLVLPGGTDIDPYRYGEGFNGAGGVNYALDELQFSNLDKFVRAKKPVLGICRGGQLINVYFGGSLIQDIPNHYGVMHATSIEKGSWLYGIYGSSLTTNSYHHQAVKKLGNSLKIVEKTSTGIVEGIEHKTLPIYGVQWHPEMQGDSGDKLLRKFLEECASYF